MPAAGLGSYVEALVRKHDVDFSVGLLSRYPNEWGRPYIRQPRLQENLYNSLVKEKKNYTILTYF